MLVREATKVLQTRGELAFMVRGVQIGFFCGIYIGQSLHRMAFEL